MKKDEKLSDDELEERMYSRLNKRSVHKDNGCIETTWKAHSNGHTNAKWKGRQYLAYRLAWEFYKTPIKNGMQINHKCHNGKCINVEHLYEGTQSDNMRDSYNAKTNPLYKYNVIKMEEKRLMLSQMVSKLL